MSEPRHINIGDIMTREIRTVGRMATVQEAMELMRDAGVSSLAVERRDERDEFGLLVVSDIAREVIAENKSPERINVYEIMSKPVLTLPVNMEVKYGVRLLVKFQLSRALVVDGKRTPVGIVTLRDMVLRHTKSEGNSSFVSGSGRENSP
ncbi:MAG: CBS domain-containing protein [Rhodospirillales bacterium]|jgi:predicted transcriptional regulator|nr:CBS domain-containing protein [Rhodospirillales bacterium]HIJ42703.1 CBS domain-containing protein [Rhodospirillaceae bacterium]MDP7097441.1 CBS domain-containing protein [Rhodospirillales bacterium]MDP7215243.1 CBS domain-containing protein [Rhodospirillales bacterium]HIJ44757.1 CBS domain-containing protein [Rhodospirillaceae bacterium]